MCVCVKVRISYFTTIIYNSSKIIFKKYIFLKSCCSFFDFFSISFMNTFKLKEYKKYIHKRISATPENTNNNR